MKLEDLPTISVIIPVWNAEPVIGRCLTEVRKQDYPQENIEIILIDGGSDDRTMEIAKPFNTEIIHSSHRDQEYNRVLGIKKAKYEILLFLDSDNFLPHKDWLRRMIEPFIKDESIVATQPLRYHYHPKDSLLNRYFALTGVNDPVGGYYLGKRDRLSYMEDYWTLAGEAVDKGEYYKVKFDPDDVPSLGANGYMVRRKAMLEIEPDPKTAHHMDLNYDLICSGYRNFGIVKDTIIHQSSSSILLFFWKKLLFARRHHLREHAPRKCPVYTSDDKFKILLFILSALTVVPPLCFSIKGYKKIPDIAWFLHPVICLLFLFTYGLATIDFSIRKLFALKIKHG